MSRRSDKFDLYMVKTGAAKHAKFRRLTTAERHAFFLGVLSLAAQAPIRGCLLVGDLHADETDVAGEADVLVKDARSALEKLRAVGVIYRDEDLGCERVHDFDEFNPAPKRDDGAAERMRRYRARLAARNGKPGTEPNKPPVTESVTRNVTEGDGRNVTVRDGLARTCARGEVEVEVEELPPSPFAVELEEWLGHYETTTGHQLPGRATKAFHAIAASYTARRDEGYPAEDLKLATVGAHADEYRRENGYDTADSILRPTKIASLVAKGKLRTGGTQRPVTSVQLGERLRGGPA